MSDSDNNDTLHSYFRPEASPPPSKRARADDATDWASLRIDASELLDMSDEESDNESLTKRSVRSGISSSPATVRPPADAAAAGASDAADAAKTGIPDWVANPSNADQTCESQVRFDAMKELAIRRLHKACQRAVAAAPTCTTATPKPDHILIESDDEDAPPPPAAPAAPPPVVQPPLPTAVEEDEADTSLVVDLYDSPARGPGPRAPVAALLLRDPRVRAPPKCSTPDDTDGLFSPFLLAEQVLSSAQLHSVALAMKAFERGRAFLVGDGTGVGKGRESMGVIMSHWHRSGSRRALIVSTGSLATDVRRDFDDCRIAEAFPGTTFIDASKALPKPGEVGKRAVIFTTYSQIRSPRKGYEPYAELIKARGGRSAGTLVLDEVHKGTKDRNNATYKQVEQLVEAAADSPLLCMSATFAADIEGLRLLAPRLGLVGEGDDCAFPSFGELKSALHSHKATGLELLTAQLSHEGLFLARVISYHGTRADHLSCTMTDEHERLYTTCSQIYADLWATGLYEPDVPQGLLRRQQGALLQDAHAARQAARTWSRASARSSTEGRQVVVTVLGTSEAALKRADPDEIEQSGGVSALRDEVLATIEYGREKCNPSASAAWPSSTRSPRASSSCNAEPLRRARPVQARAPRVWRGRAHGPHQRAALGRDPQRLVPAEAVQRHRGGAPPLPAGQLQGGPRLGRRLHRHLAARRRASAAGRASRTPHHDPVRAAVVGLRRAAAARPRAPLGPALAAALHHDRHHHRRAALLGRRVPAPAAARRAHHGRPARRRRLPHRPRGRGAADRRGQPRRQESWPT